MAYQKRTYSDAEKAEYWKRKAQGGNAQRGNFGNNWGNQGSQYKKSGAKFTRYRDGRFAGTDLVHIAAWRKTKSGLQTLSMNPLDGTEHVGKEKGKTHIVYIGKLINKSAGTITTVLGSYQKESGKLVLNDLGLVVSPNGHGKTKSGKVVKGYFGRNVRNS